MDEGLPETNYIPYYIKKEKRWKSWRGHIRFYFDGYINKTNPYLGKL